MPVKVDQTEKDLSCLKFLRIIYKRSEEPTCEETLIPLPNTIKPDTDQFFNSRILKTFVLKTTKLKFKDLRIR